MLKREFFYQTQNYKRLSYLKGNGQRRMCECELCNKFGKCNLYGEDCKKYINGLNFEEGKISVCDNLQA